MSITSIAVNRFGYGLRRGQTPPADPVRSLRAQFDAYDPAPSLLAGREDSSDKAGEILELLRQNRRARQRATSNDTAAQMTAIGKPGDPFNGLPPEIRSAYLDAGKYLRRDVALRTNVAVQSDTPLIERMVHFWSNHFSVSARKPGTQHQVGNHEFAAIRPHVLGKFSDMLKAAVLHPAMLLYLDQFQSVGPNSTFMQRRGRRGANGNGPRGLNENLAREILELHTLGVDGGYSQGDVTEFARALTGWTVRGLRQIERFAEPQDGGAAFVQLAHEPGSRQIMGRNYRDNGPKQALEMLDDLAAHPSTARFIATKLARHFAGDDPPASLVTRLETDFRKTGGNLESLTKTLIDSPECWTEGPVKYRQPFEWLVSVLRITGVEGLNDRRISGALNEIGQVPWRAPSPAGYDDVEGSWAGPDALFRRVELAERIARNAPADDIMNRAEAAFPDALTDNTRLWLSRAESGSQALGLLLVSPEMMRR